MITSSTLRARLGAFILAGALALGVVACGGGDDDEAGTTDYKAAINTLCGSIQKAQTTTTEKITALQKDGSIGSDPQEALKAVSGALAGFGDDLDAAVDEFKSVEAPSKYEDFHSDAVKVFDQLASRVTQAAEDAEKGNLEALQSFGGQIDKIETPDVPDELQKDVPNCDKLEST